MARPEQVRALALKIAEVLNQEAPDDGPLHAMALAAVLGVNAACTSDPAAIIAAAATAATLIANEVRK